MDTGSPGIAIAPLSPGLRIAAVELLARAFVTNPLHVAAFGAGNLARNEAFFRAGLTVMKGDTYLACDGPRPLGFAHWVRSPDCQVSPAEKLRIVPALVRDLGLCAALRVIRWLSAWSTLDPPERHVHLGPIGIDPSAQGRHIGTQLMQMFCDELEQRSLPGYLETDRPENVRFYERFGFRVIAEQAVIGVPNFFMLRRSPAR